MRLVGDAGIVGDAARRGPAQLLEDFARAREGEAAFAAEGRGDVLDDAPVLPGVAGAIDGLVDLDDPAFDLRDGALVLLVQRAGQHDVGVAGRLVEEEVDADVELELVEHARDESAVRQRHLGVEADAEQAADLAAVDQAEDLVGVHAGAPGNSSGADAPDLGDVLAVLGLADVAAAGKLVALLAVLAPALAVALAGDGRVAAVGPADPARGQDHVDGAQAVLDAVACGARCRGRAAGSWSWPRPTTRPPGGSAFSLMPVTWAVLPRRPLA